MVPRATVRTAAAEAVLVVRRNPYRRVATLKTPHAIAPETAVSSAKIRASASVARSWRAIVSVSAEVSAQGRAFSRT